MQCLSSGVRLLHVNRGAAVDSRARTQPSAVLSSGSQRQVPQHSRLARRPLAGTWREKALTVQQGPAPGVGTARHRSSVRCNAVVDPWSVNAESIASQLFAVSLFPYLAFLFFLNKAKGQPLVNFGFAFLLVFVFATIPAGIYAKKVYGLSLANVDWLHGGAESLLTVTNIFIVLGLRQKLSQLEQEKKDGDNKPAE